MSKLEIKKAFDAEKVTPGIISLICFGCSMIFSVYLIRTQGSTPFSQNIYSALGIGLDLSKLFFCYIAITKKDYEGWYRAMCGVIGIACFAYSITASLGFSVNESQALKNISTINSVDYKNQITSTETRTAAISRLEKESAALQKEKEAELLKWDPKKYKTIRDNLAKEYNTKIEAKSNKITELQGAAINPTTSTIKIESDKGYSSLFSTNPFSDNEKRFFVAVSVLLDLIGILAYVEFKRKQRKVLMSYTRYEDLPDYEQFHKENAGAAAQTQNSKVISIDKGKDKAAITNTLENLSDTSDKELKKPNQYKYGTSEIINTLSHTDLHDELKTKNPIGFKSESVPTVKKEAVTLSDTTFNKDDIMKYLNRMYETAVKNVSKGYKTIGNDIEMDLEKARKIKGYLEQSGIIEVIGNKTFIILDKAGACGRIVIA